MSKYLLQNKQIQELLQGRENAIQFFEKAQRHKFNKIDEVEGRKKYLAKETARIFNSDERHDQRELGTLNYWLEPDLPQYGGNNIVWFELADNRDHRHRFYIYLNTHWLDYEIFPPKRVESLMDEVHEIYKQLLGLPDIK